MERIGGVGGCEDGVMEEDGGLNFLHHEFSPIVAVQEHCQNGNSSKIIFPLGKFLQDDFS